MCLEFSFRRKEFIGFIYNVWGKGRERKKGREGGREEVIEEGRKDKREKKVSKKE